MKILMVTEASSAGVGRHVIDLCTALADHGDEVHLIYATGRTDRAFEDGVNRLPSRVHTQVLEMRRAPHTSDVGAMRVLRRYLRDHGPFDVVHGQSSKGGALVRLAREAGSAVVYTPHCVYTLNPTVRGWKRFVYSRAEVWLSKRTDAVIAVSPTEAQHLHSLGFAKDRVHCVPNGIPPVGFETKAAAREALGLAENALVIGYLARLSQQKNPILMVEAFAAIAANHPEAVLAMAGTGDLESECRHRAAMLGVSNRVHWLGYQTPDVLLPSADLFALSSRYEGMPYVYLEALACGLPIVTTNVGGADLAIEDGVNGCLVRGGDVSSLASALDRVLGSQELRAQMALASRRLSTRFSLERMMEGTLAAYEAAIATARGPQQALST